MKSLSRLSPIVHDALLTAGKKASSYSPSLRSPLSAGSMGRFAYDTSVEYDSGKTATVYCTEEPVLALHCHELPRRKISNLKLVTKIERNVDTRVPKTAPTPRVKSPNSSKKTQFAMVGNEALLDTYEYKYDIWKDNVQHWKNFDVQAEPVPPSSHVEAIKAKKSGLGNRQKTVFFQQQLNHGPLPPQHLGLHENL